MRSVTTMRGITGKALLAAAIFIPYILQAETEGKKFDLSVEQMSREIEFLTEHVKTDWAYYELKTRLFKIDPDSLRFSALRKIGNETDETGYVEVLMEYVAGLWDGHSSVFHPAMYGRQFVPFYLTRIKNRFYVKEVLSGANLQRGAELHRINGKPIGEYFEECYRINCGSTEANREYNTLIWMRMSKQESSRIEFSLRGGARSSIEVKNVLWDQAGSIEWKKVRERTGYIRLPSFAQDHAVLLELTGSGIGQAAAMEEAISAKKKSLKKAFSELSDTDAIIIDLRGNGGGTDLLGNYLANFICDVKASPNYYHLQNHFSETLLSTPEFARLKDVGKAERETRTAIPVKRYGEVKRYGGRVAVLTDAGCFSTTSNFLHYVKCSEPKVLVVGRPDGAGSGAPRPIVKLPHSGIQIGFCIMRIWDPCDKFVESNPVIPDVPVEWTPEDLLNGNDPDILAAVKALGG